MRKIACLPHVREEILVSKRLQSDPATERCTRPIVDYAWGGCNEGNTGSVIGSMEHPGSEERKLAAAVTEVSV
jgi:hypothetical protein